MGLDPQDGTVMYISIVVLFLVNFVQNRIPIRDKLEEQNLVFRWSIYFFSIFVLIIFGIYGPSAIQTQFIYFQF